jgi:eukaryotic-like serine/threonine-protein kinase
VVKSTTPSADTSALGVVAFEMLTGQLPFGRLETAQAISAYLFQPVPNPCTLVPDLPHQVADAILHALEKILMRDTHRCVILYETWICKYQT